LSSRGCSSLQKVSLLDPRDITNLFTTRPLDFDITLRSLTATKDYKEQVHLKMNLLLTI
jgi:hypothetical protein